MSPALVLLLTGACIGFLAGGAWVWLNDRATLRAYRREHAAQEALIAHLSDRTPDGPVLTLAALDYGIGRN